MSPNEGLAIKLADPDPSGRGVDMRFVHSGTLLVDWCRIEQAYRASDRLRELKISYVVVSYIASQGLVERTPYALYLLLVCDGCFPGLQWTREFLARNNRKVSPIVVPHYKRRVVEGSP